jgi:hypothetical protein
MFFLLQHSNRLSEFIYQGGRIDACSCNTLISVAGCHQCAATVPPFSPNGTVSMIHLSVVQQGKPTHPSPSARQF